MNVSITKLLNEIREVHSKFPSRDKYPVHIEIFSSDSIVGLHQYVGDFKNLTMIRYHKEPDTFFDLELCSLLTNYLSVIKNKY